jgi:hypothetical protein
MKHFVAKSPRAAMNRPNGFGDAACPSVERRALVLTRWQITRNGNRSVLTRKNRRLPSALYDTWATSQ